MADGTAKARARKTSPLSRCRDQTPHSRVIPSLRGCLSTEAARQRRWISRERPQATPSNAGCAIGPKSKPRAKSQPRGAYPGPEAHRGRLPTLRERRRSRVDAVARGEMTFVRPHVYVRRCFPDIGSPPKVEAPRVGVKRNKDQRRTRFFWILAPGFWIPCGVDP